MNANPPKCGRMRIAAIDPPIMVCASGTKAMFGGVKLARPKAIIGVIVGA